MNATDAEVRITADDYRAARVGAIDADAIAILDENIARCEREDIATANRARIEAKEVAAKREADRLRALPVAEHAVAVAERQELELALKVGEHASAIGRALAELAAHTNGPLDVTRRRVTALGGEHSRPADLWKLAFRPEDLIEVMKMSLAVAKGQGGRSLTRQEIAARLNLGHLVHLVDREPAE